jgi:hypothetical protein
MKTCTSNKKMFPSESIAEEALISAWTAYDYTGKNGPLGVYLCDICGSYHLTSKGPTNKRLADFIASGELKRHAEASRWLDKMKKRK